MVFVKRKWLVAWYVFLTIWIWPAAGGATEKGAEYPDVFTHGDIRIEAGQTAGWLMVAGGNAVVAGRITEGMVVIDGNVTIDSGAVVAGSVIVAGGTLTVQPEACVEQTPWVVAPRGHPLVPVMVGGLLLLGAASLVFLPALFWLLGWWFKKTPWYPPVRKWIARIEQRWPALYILASLAISAFMLTVFTALAWETLFRNAAGLFDNIFIWLVRYFAGPGVDRVMLGISDAGFGVSYIIVVALAYGALTRYRRWREMAVLTICLGGGAVLNFLLKNLFHRSRPDLFRVVQETGYSFPSGHAMASMCFYGMLAYLIMRVIPSWRGRLAVLTLAVFLIVAIGISRIYLGVHYPTDVVAGYAAGSMWLAFCISLLMWWEKDA